MTKLSKRIPDLFYVVAKANTVFTRAGHLTVFYRHDKDGNPYLYHVISHYGSSGVQTRADAARAGREVCERKRNMGYRETYVPAAHRDNVKAALKAKTGRDVSLRGHDFSILQATP